MAQFAREYLLDLFSGGTDGYVRIVGSDEESYRMSIQAFIDMVKNGGTNVLYGTSSTAGATRDKLVTCPAFDGTDGTLIVVYFSSGNTNTLARLNINGTGAASIYSYYGGTGTSWLKTGAYLFYYDASIPKYVLVGATERVPSSTNPSMDGTAAAGSSKEYARADHVHPKDTSKADASTVGTLANLTTTEKSNLVGAINEVHADTNDLKEDKADINGAYSYLTAGNAEQLLADVHTEDKMPYNFRASGGGVEVGTRELDKIVGGTVAWNQLCKANDAQTTTNNIVVTAYTGGRNYAGTASAQTDLNMDKETIRFLAGHKYLMQGVEGGSSSTYQMFTSGSTASGYGSLKSNAYIMSPTASSTEHFRIRIYNGAQVNVSATPQVTDLTQMLGTTIADYIYSLETATAGAGIAKLKSWGFFPKDYYAYDTGSLQSVQTSKHVTVGFNAWDEQWEQGEYHSTSATVRKSSSANHIRSKNPIRVVEGATYFMNSASKNVHLIVADMNGNVLYRTISLNNGTFTIPSGGMYVYFNMAQAYGTTYNHDICINLSDASRNGQYEPYVKHEYALDADLVLRGIPKLDANNQLYYDGDTYEADGTVTRYWAERAYQAGDATDGSSMITDGTKTVYKLTTPTTETADAFQSPQIVDPSGTEEYVTTGIVPVGHRTEYPADLKGAIERVMVQVPKPPTSNGTYVLKATKTNSGITYAWTAE